MQPLHIFILDDEKNACDFIEFLIKEAEPSAVFIKSGNPIEARKQLIDNDFDMLFCDIAMPFKDGLSLLREVAAVKQLPFTVIVSAYSDFNYARAAIDVNVAGYLVKPLVKADIRRMLDKYHEQNHRSDSSDKILINKGVNNLLVNVDDILAVCKESRYYLEITTKDGCTYRIKDNLNALHRQLPEQFVRLNRQCIINADEIKHFSDNWHTVHVTCCNKAICFHVSRSASAILKRKHKHKKTQQL